MDRLKGGERERFMVNLANRFVNTRTLHCYFLTNQPEKFEYNLDPKVGRVNVFKGKNRDWSFINKFIRENEIKMIFYNGYDANEMKALQSFGKPVVFFNHDTYFTQLAYNHNFDYFKFFNRSKGVVNFIPPEIKHFQEYGHKNVISMHKPIAYDFFDVKPAKLIGKRIILFGTSNYKELMKKTFEKGLKIFAKILEKDPEARLYVIADFSGYTNIVPLYLV